MLTVEQKRKHRRELQGEDLDRFAQRHGPFVADVLGAAGTNNRRVTLFDDVQAVPDLFLGVDGCANQVHFQGIDGKTRHEFTVSKHPNGILVNSADVRHSARPQADGFLMGDHKPSSKNRIWGPHPNVDGQDVKNGCVKWYSGVNTSVYGGRIMSPQGRVLDFLSIQPDEMSWGVMAWDIIHTVVPLEELLSEDFNPEVVVASGIGIREAMFEGAHRTLVCREDGKFNLVALSHYQGTALSKKPTGFGCLQSFLIERGGVMSHSNVVRVVDALSAAGASQGEIAVVIEWFARSAHKKSELGYPTLVSDGHAVLAKGVLVKYKLDLRPLLQIHGDDGIGRLSLNSAEEARTVWNTEVGGRFERDTDHVAEDEEGRDNYPEVSRYLDGAEWHETLVLNLSADPGQQLYGYNQHEYNGQRTRNPRVNMKFSRLNQIGFHYSTDAVKVDHRAYGIGTLEDWAPWKPFNQLPPGLAFVNGQVGLCKAKSDSVVGGTKHEVISDWGETIGCFSYNTEAEIANAMYRMYAAMGDEVKHWVVPVGFIGPNFAQPHGDEAQHLWRDGLLLEQMGEVDWELGFSPSAMCGKGPERWRFFGEEIPTEVLNPYRQYGEQGYQEVMKRMHRFYCEQIRRVRASGDLDEGPKRMFELFEEMDPVNSTPDYLEEQWRLFTELA